MSGRERFVVLILTLVILTGCSSSGDKAVDPVQPALSIDVIGEGLVTADYYNQEPCFLVRHVHNYGLGAGFILLTIEMIWFEWIVDDGRTAAYMFTFNNSTNPYVPPAGQNRFNNFAPYADVRTCSDRSEVHLSLI